MIRLLRNLAGSPAAFLAPAAAMLSAVTLYPILYVLWLSLQRHSLIAGPASFVGLDNFVRLLGDGRFWNALGNTIYFTALSVAGELVLGLAIALLLARGFRGLLSYVEWHNSDSLKSCYRMGYRDFGRIYVARILGRYFWRADAGCAPFQFDLCRTDGAPSRGP